MTRALYLQHPSSLEHDTGEHPERPERIRAIEAALVRRDWLGLERVPAPAVERDALDRLEAERVLVLDWDVHHGNGTNDIFYDTNSVLYISIHQSPLYPGTGSLSENGSGAGEGYTVNLPVSPGAGHAEFVGLVQHVVVPIAHEYVPDLVLVSAGFDAHRDDPLANCTLTEESYAAMASAMRRVSRELGAPLGFVLEGGYDLRALAGSVAATIGAAMDGASPAAVEPGALVARARAHYRRWWPSLAQV